MSVQTSRVKLRRLLITKHGYGEGLSFFHRVGVDNHACHGISTFWKQAANFKAIEGYKQPILVLTSYSSDLISRYPSNAEARDTGTYGEREGARNGRYKL